MLWIRKIYDWMSSKVHTKYSLAWLLGLFFLESSVFMIPIDPLLILFCIEKPGKSFFFAAVATAASVFGGIFGYLIGAFMWQSVGQHLVNLLIGVTTFESIRLKYEFYQVWAVLIAGFTPVPYKAITLSAGFCHLPLIPFIICSILARGSRFFLIAGAISIWGEKIKFFIDRHFNKLVVSFVIMVVFFILLLK